MSDQVSSLCDAGCSRRANHVVPRLAAAVVAFAIALLPCTAPAQGGTEIVRGQVLMADAIPLEDVDVRVTGLQTQTVRAVRTNSSGVFTVLFVDGEGEYVVSVRAIGFSPVLTRVVRTGDSNVLVANVTLARLPTMLDTITVQGVPRVRPPSADGMSVGADEQDALQGALFSLDPTDLDALALSVPGVFSLSDSGYSVLGAPEDQNNTLIDGSTFRGSAVPQDAIAGATLSTTTYDLSRGGFSGGQMSIRTRGGSNTFTGRVAATLADPHLAWADPAAPRQPGYGISWNGSLGGPVKKGKAYYFGALDMRRSTTDTWSLASISDQLLVQNGLSRDTIAALSQELGGMGVPLTTDAIPSDKTNDQGSAFARLDLLPTGATTISVTGMGTWNGQDGVGISPLGFPSTGNGMRSKNFGVNVAASTYFRGIFDELKTSVQTSASTSGPYLDLPHGTVRVGTEYTDVQGGLVPLSFGGGTSGASESHTRSWETTNELSWFTANSRHQLKFGQSFTLTGSRNSNVGNQGGSFTYQSLADIANNVPASYSRTLSSRERSTSAIGSAFWLSGVSRSRSNALQLQYGVRLDIARSGTVPRYNPAVDSTFGRRTDRIPRDVGLSPRVGFSWMPGGSSLGGRGMPALSRMRSSFTRGLRQRPLTISGGVGAFRGVVQPSRIAALVDATGLGNTIRQLTCVGDATPIPDWALYAEDPDAVPSECLDGRAPEEFSSDHPHVQLFDPSFSAPTSWRANLHVDGIDVKGWQLGVSGTYSLGVNGESGVDLNLRRTPLFTLPAEQGRPVFVSEAAIVPTTGSIAPGASRIFDDFGSVTNYVSDLRSVNTQLQLSLNSPEPLFGKLPLNVTYTYSNSRAQERGLDGSTAGDPFRREWAAGRQPAHQVRMMTSLDVKFISIGLRATLTSGVPYSPMIAGDVNGDGRSNDRAFIFDPATTSDTLLARQMGDLLAVSPQRVRDCLERQFGRVAGRNSCHTGWQLQPDVNLGIRPFTPHLGVADDRLQLSITTVNAMGAMMRLFGLSNTSIGQLTNSSNMPEPTLLYVDGFDPATRQFRYRVNQQFGEQGDRARRSLHRRVMGSFQIQLGASYRFGGEPRRSLAQSLRLVSSDKRAAPLTEEQVRARLRGLTRNPLTSLLRLRDSLLLTEQQVKELRSVSAELDEQVDTLISPLVHYVVERGKKVDDKELQKRLSTMMPKMTSLLRATMERAGGYLTEDQVKRLPMSLRRSLRGGGGGSGR